MITDTRIRLTYRPRLDNPLWSDFDMFKTANVGSADRIVRIVLGVFLIAIPNVVASTAFENPALRWGMPIVGLVLVATALVRFCPLYRIIGASTCKTS